MGCIRSAQARMVACITVLSLVSRHATVATESQGPSRSLLATNAAAPAPAPENESFEPSQAGYAARHDSINTAFKLNQTFFANLSATPVPPIQKVSNGTFEVKPVAEAGGGRIESANTDGKLL